MNKANAVLALVIVGGIALAITVFELVGRQRGTSPIGTVIRTALSSERIVTPEEKARKDVEAAKVKPAPPTRRSAATPPAAAKPTPPPARPPTRRPAAPAPAPAEPQRVLQAPRVEIAEARPPAGLAVGVGQRRLDTFVAGNRAEWSSFDIFFEKAMVLRAGGAVRAGNALSGPGGIASGGANGGAAVRVLPGAPHLALIGRVCSAEMCSPPFLLGARSVLCPSAIGIAGDLQLWTNNYIQVDGYQTLASYRDVAGGYRFEVESAADEACDEPASATAPPATPAEALARGEVLRSSSFSVSSRQNAWKPFFLPLDRPLLIRASGEIQPQERTRATGPNGIVVPDIAVWTYPGSKSVVVDSEHSLIDRSLPYQALIARLCSASACGEPFLVGSVRTICPDPRLNDRLELWINHIVVRGGDLQVPFADLSFQGRRGEYRFEVANAPTGSCGSGDRRP